VPNQLLLDLPADEISQITPQLIPTPLIPRQIVTVRGHRINDVYLVDSGIVSLTVKAGNIEVEVGLVGPEGVVGVSALLHADSITVYQAIVQVAGTASRLTANAAFQLGRSCPTFSQRCFRYIDSLLNQTTQIAGCNVRHSVQERLARWLMMTRDRLQSDNLPLTHEFLAIMLGVSRSGVSLAANTLQTAGLVRQERGRIVVVNADGLRSVSCDCYEVVHALHDFSLRSVTN